VKDWPLTPARLRRLEEMFAEAREPWRGFGLELCAGVREAWQTNQSTLDLEGFGPRIGGNGKRVACGHGVPYSERCHECDAVARRATGVGMEAAP
jgi:hypothetical protein